MKSVILGSVNDFIENGAFALAAGLAYYSLLSMAPLLLVVIAVAGVFFSSGVVQNELLEQIDALVGAEGAALARTVIANTESQGQSWLSLIVGMALTLFGATTVFAHLQVSLNRLWGVVPKPSNAIWAFIKHRLLSFALVITLGFLLMVSLVVSALLAGLYDYIDTRAPGAALAWQILNVGVSFSLATLLIGLMFRYLPDADIHWRDIWLGAFITALLFAAGKWAIGLYLGQATVASSFGAAGSAVVFMVWVYYASLIIFFGAAITHAVAVRRGEPIRPMEHAETADEADRRVPAA